MERWYTKVYKKYVCLKPIFSCFLSVLAGTAISNSSAYIPIAATPGQTIWQIMDTVQGLKSANHIITQATLPAIIAAPGVYSVAQDLTISSGASAITINADDVVLDLQGHIITATGSVTLITIAGNNVSIRNGSLMSAVSSANLILISAAQNKFACENVVLYGLSSLTGTRGIFAPLGVTNSLIRDCQFANLTDGILFNIDCSQGIIDDCYFTDCSDAAIIIGPGSSEFVLTDLNVHFGGSGIILNNALYIDISDTVIGRVGTNNLQAGINMISANFSTLRNVSVIGTSTENFPSIPGIAGINVGAGQGYIIENCTVNNPSGDGILLGPGGIVDTVVRGCITNNCGGVGLNISAPPDSSNHVYNTLSFSNVTADFVGVPAVLIATSDIATSTATYWVNVGY